jgi:hypothetical protein
MFPHIPTNLDFLMSQEFITVGTQDSASAVHYAQQREAIGFQIHHHKSDPFARNKPTIT